MEEQTLPRSIPGPVGLLGVLTVVLLAALGVWSFADSTLLGSGDYLAPLLGVLAVVVVAVGALAALGARSREWLANPYW
ncbi:hypothetical protein [Haloterrigena salifodinae]|uniref:hypothetical protein n=1 Tax=Haloterrigena salifodinae TaxID=2675099 RepID=UPI000F8696C7|nr:hypothetical protein [Haloterrigena salifodinae]